MNASATDIDIPYPEGVEELRLRISMGACVIKIRPGAEDRWAKGTYDDPTGGLPARVDLDGGVVQLRQSHSIHSLRSLTGRPRLDLKLGAGKPYALRIESGASEADVDLGGLPLWRLVIKQGAGRSNIDFSNPNPETMSQLDVDAGAVDLTMRNLANAGFEEMSLDGGAATYDFDFGGTLARDGEARMNAGLSTLRLTVPATTAARITPGSVLGSLDVGDGLTKQEGAFMTAAAVSGASPQLSVTANVTLGALTLKVS